MDEQWCVEYADANIWKTDDYGVVCTRLATSQVQFCSVCFSYVLLVPRQRPTPKAVIIEEVFG
jgi:hypothetical protein